MGGRVLARHVVVGVLACHAVAGAASGQLLGGLPGGGPTWPPPVLQPVLSKLDPLMLARVSLSADRSDVLVQAVDLASLDAVTLLIADTGGIVGRQLPIVDAVAANISNSSLAILTNSPLVRRVALDRLVLGTMDRVTRVIRTAAVQERYGFDGAGIGVAVIDSGVTSWHDDLGTPDQPGMQRVDRFVDFVNDQPGPYDDYGHGTHVAGIIAGNGADSGGARAGVAPAVRLTALKVLDGSGRGRISDVIAALGYVLDHHHELNIRIANLSIGAGVYESYESDLLPQAAKRVVDEGIVVIAAAGNGGRDSFGRRQYGAITSPANAPWVLTVGASSHMGTIDRDDDTVARFSSRGPTAVDRAAKPDLVAPGVGIVSLSDPNSQLYATRSSYLLPGTVATSYLPYLSLSGTSQATPVVAGTVALMLQANPALTPNAVKAILQYTAERESRYDALTQGAGFVNGGAAVRLAAHFAAPDTFSYPSTRSWSEQLIWGNQRMTGGRLTASANAWAPDVGWSATTTPGGAVIEWGVLEASCSSSTTSDSTIMTASTDTTTTSSGGTYNPSPWRYDSPGENVVWGEACGGEDCQGQTWTVDDATVVWGTTGDGDTVVWGTTGDGDTVVWGTTGDEDVMWDQQQQCLAADPQPVEQHVALAA
ncbi:MAG TPA: S8 family peptidase [Vicinamibacterales bacterium]|nr:S8 family peptidase [Vicinamibacterales bacterium]